MELNTNILLSIQSTQPAEQIFFFLMYYLLTIQQMYFRRRNNTVAKISRVLANVPTMCYGNCLLLWNWCPFVFFLAVVGEKEKLTNSVNVRTRDNKVHGELSVAEVLARLTLLKDSRCRNAEEEF